MQRKTIKTKIMAFGLSLREDDVHYYMHGQGMNAEMTDKKINIDSIGSNSREISTDSDKLLESHVAELTE